MVVAAARVEGGGSSSWPPSSGFRLSAFFLSLGSLSSAPILSFGGSEETQPVHPSVSGSPVSLKNPPDLFPQTLFGIYSVPGIKGENKVKEHLSHFSGGRNLTLTVGGTCPRSQQI